MEVLQYDETIIYSFVQFWDGVYNSFSCAYSGRKEINSFSQFWGEVYNLSPEDHRVQQGEKVLNCGILLRRACYN